MSCWCAVVPLLTNRCLYLGLGWEWGFRGQPGYHGCQGALGVYIWNMNTVSCKALLKTQDGVLQTIAYELMWTGPKLVPLLANRCLSLGALRGHGARCLYWGGGRRCQGASRCQGALEGYIWKWRQSLAKKSWKLNMLYCRQKNMSSGQLDLSYYHSWQWDASVGEGVHLS